MEIIKEHRFTKQVAITKIDGLFTKLAEEHNELITSSSHSWNDDTMQFSLQAGGFNVHGCIMVTDTKAILQVDVPLLLRPLEGKIRSTIEKIVDDLLNEYDSQNR